MNKKEIILEIEAEISETKQAMYNLVDDFVNGTRCESEIMHYLDVNRHIVATLDELLERAKG